MTGPTEGWGFSKTVEYAINNHVSVGEAELDFVSYKIHPSWFVRQSKFLTNHYSGMAWKSYSWCDLK